MGTLAVAGPAWQQLPQPVDHRLLGRVLVFDLSLSMKSTDVTPDRLTRARYKLTDLVRRGQGIQQGLVVFAGDAFVVVPVTDDIDTLANLIPSLDTSTMPVQGSRADLGIDRAVTLLENTGFRRASIILITDGVSEQTAQAAARAAARGFEVSVLAVGTKTGAPVPLSQGTLLKDQSGNIVIPGVDQDHLRRIAGIGGGRFSLMTADDSDIQLVGKNYASFDFEHAVDQQANNDGQPGTDEYRTDRWIDQGPWLLLPLLLITALVFRRGWVLMICCALVPATVPTDANAFEWEDLWLRKDQQASRLFQAEQFTGIPENAPPQWLGASRYRSGDYAGATESFLKGEVDAPTTHYNAGNALARSFALEQALAAYDRALQLNPQMTDALENRDLVAKLLEQQKQQQNSDSTDDKSTQDGQEAEPQEKTGGDFENENRDSDNQDEDEQLRRQARENSDQAKSEQSDNNQNLEETDNDDNESPGSNTSQEIDVSQQTKDENQQALEQWLKRIPDDPGGLLRRKFARQYLLRDTPSSTQQW
jgi:Ca-activated chloride channel family protein